MKPEFFTNTPLKAAYDAVAPDKTKWTKFLEQMIAFAGTPFNIGDTHIAKITSPVLLISGDNDGLDKVELIKTYQLLGGAVSADLGPMPKSHRCSKSTSYWERCRSSQLCGLHPDLPNHFPENRQPIPGASHFVQYAILVLRANRDTFLDSHVR